MPYLNPEDIHPYDPRFRPLLVPVAGIFDEPSVTVCINREWIPHLDGVIGRLLRHNAWIGEDLEQERGTQNILKLLIALANGMDCMPSDPCCPELIELTRTQILNQYLSTYNTWNQNNADQRTMNTLMYNGDYHSLWLNGGDNYNSGGNGHLCNAIDHYVNEMMRGYAQQAALLLAVSQAASAAFFALGAALGVFTAGASIGVGLAVGVGLTLAANEWTSLLGDTEAQRKVKCCMFDALENQPVDGNTFLASADNCGFDAGSREETLRQQVAWTNHQPGNHEAFMVALSQASEGDTRACDCGCEIEDVVLVSDNPQTTITRLTDTTWHYQSTYKPGDDPGRPDSVQGHVRDQFYRCVNFTHFTEAHSAGSTRNCEGVWNSVIGGQGGLAIEIKWVKWDGIAIDTIITVACDE